MSCKQSICLAVLNLVLVLIHFAVADENRWSTSGPYAANITTIALHPLADEIIYVGTVENGIYKTTNGGEDWVPLDNHDLPTNMRSIRFHPAAPDTIYASTVSGFYKSSNMGRDWNSIVLPIGSQAEINSFLIHPSQPAMMIIGDMWGHHYRSTDGGENWMTMDLPLVAAQKHVSDPMDPDKVYLVTQSASARMSLFRSNDFGMTWENIHNDLDTTILGYDLAVDPVDHEVLFFVGSGFWNNTGRCVSKSVDGGDHWFDITPDSLNEAHVISIAVSPVDHNTVVICTTEDGVLKSVDGGSTWRKKNTGLTVRTTSRIVIDPETGVYYLGTYFDGIYRSDDEGEGWRKISCNITNARCLDISFNARSPDTIFAATANGIFRSTDGTSNWEYLDFLGPDYKRFGECVKVDPIMGNFIYAGFSPHYWGPENVGIARSTDFGNSWTFFYDGLPSFTSYNRIDVAYDDADRHRIFLASTSGLFYSDDFGDFWMRQESLPEENIRSLAVSSANSGQVYAATNSLYMSTDFGDTWDNLQGPSGDNYINEITCDPVNTDVLYCCKYREGIYKSTDSGHTWTNIGNNLPHVEGWFVVSGVAINPSNPNTLLANVYNQGIYISDNGGENWSDFNEGLRTMYYDAVTMIDPIDTNKVYLATSDQSVWSITRTPTSIDDEITLPKDFISMANYPNPFNASTRITFDIPQGAEINLGVYNVLGQRVATLYSGLVAAGEHSITWNADDYPSGVYFARLESSMYAKNIRMVLLK